MKRFLQAWLSLIALCIGMAVFVGALMYLGEELEHAWFLVILFLLATAALAFLFTVNPPELPPPPGGHRATTPPEEMPPPPSNLAPGGPGRVGCTLHTNCQTGEFRVPPKWVEDDDEYRWGNYQ